MSAQPIHGTVIVSGTRGVLLRGPSGSGKSDLALRLMDRGFILVADDQVLISRAGDHLIAEPPPALAGWLEVRGLGLVSMPYCPKARLDLAIDLIPRDQVERLPNPQSIEFLGLDIPLVKLHAFDAATELKISYALARLRPNSDFGLTS